MANEQSSTFREHEIEWDDIKISRLWDYYSRTPAFSDVYFAKAFGHHILRHSGLPLGEPLEVLDFGCGPGFIWDHLHQLGARWRYTALDFSRDSVKKVIEKGKGDEHFKGAKHISSLPTDLPQTHFDIVLLLEVIEHLNDAYLDGTLAEVARLLKQGGLVIITTPNEEDLSKSKKLCPECGAIFHEWQHVRSWSVRSLTVRLKQYNFSLRMAKTLDFTAQEVLGKMRRIAKRLRTGDPGNPHLIAVFQKI
jgi:2-polyprenyl-3-methyl-5-hydroxy-6-metoxy-1,4-benzoquinol methylase